MTKSVAIFIFNDVEVLDFAGPYEVFTTASRVFKKQNPAGSPPFQVFTVACEPGVIRARAGLVVLPDFTFADHPAANLLVIPGGVVTAELATPQVSVWIKTTAATASLTASVCTGSFLLAQAGLLDGKSAATHWEDIDEMRAMFPAVTLLDDRRWVDEGGIVTSAGISAGLDMSLHLVSRLAGHDLALRTARQMDYDWKQEA